jgi:hypothetical protein
MTIFRIHGTGICHHSIRGVEESTRRVYEVNYLVNYPGVDTVYGSHPFAGVPPLFLVAPLYSATLTDSCNLLSIFTPRSVKFTHGLTVDSNCWFTR